jgi:Domain of unknown function (DUF4338)
VHCHNLASRVLSLVCRRLAADWFSHYGYRPVLLETFVQLPRFTGTAYRAANWRYVGLTKGRGKLEKHHQAILPQGHLPLSLASRFQRDTHALSRALELFEVRFFAIKSWINPRFYS